MALLETLSSKAGQYSGRGLIAAFKLIARNFAKLEPGITDSGAADYVLGVGDKAVSRSRATAQTLTLPSNATAAIPIGTRIPIAVTGAGTLTVQAGANATMAKLAAKGATCLTGGTVWALKTGTNAWYVSGDLAAA